MYIDKDLTITKQHQIILWLKLGNKNKNTDDTDISFSSEVLQINNINR